MPSQRLPLPCHHRRYALLFKRFLQSKLQLGTSHSSQKTSFTSTAEFAAPALTPQLSCKASVTSDFCRRLVVQAELLWKANTKPVPYQARSNPKHFKAHEGFSSPCTSPGLCPLWLLTPTVPLPWSCTPMPTPPAVYPHKQRAFYSKNAEEQSNKSEKDGQHSGAGTQYALLIKGSPEGKPKSTWQLRVQKALGRKTRLRAQASALIAPLNLLPSKWQLETRRRLPKGATFNARLQKEDLQQSREISKHRLVLERKARDACWTHTCAYDSTGESLHPGLTAMTILSCNSICFGCDV